MINSIKTIGILGNGPNGAGWAARFLAHSYDVLVLNGDPAPFRTAVDQAWPILEKLGLIAGASRERLRFTADAAELAQTADFIQACDGESQQLVAVEAAAAPEILIALEAAVQTTTQFDHPERVFKALGWSPVYLLPLVELQALAGTAADTVESASKFYRWLSMEPVVVKQHVAPHLQTALAEAADLSEPDAAEIDAVLQLGLGLSSAVHGLSEMENTAVRDDALLALMRALRPFGLGAGRSIHAHDGKRYTRYEHRHWQAGDAIDAPLRLYRCDVDPTWIDYNGHMTEASYLTAFGDASDALFRYIGIDEAYRAGGHSYYTVETHINYYLECGSGDTLDFTTQILNFDAKRLHFFHSMYHASSGDLIATTEQMLVHVDTAAARSAPVKPHVQAALEAIFTKHKTLPVPKQVGRVMQIKRSG